MTTPQDRDVTILTQDVLPCGCMIRTVDNAGSKEFQIIPCRLDCKYLAYVVEESKNQDKPVETRRIT